MNTTHTPTTKREVLIARKAFHEGAIWRFRRLADADTMIRHKIRNEEYFAARAERYPLPKVTRPRVVTDKDGDDWKLDPLHGLQVRYATGSGAWCDPRSTDFLGYEPTVAELLANPTEEVEDTE